jgi:hypothetical protein
MLKRVSALLGLLLVGLLLGFAAGWVVGREAGRNALQQTVAISWGDGKYGPAFYGAQVFLEPLQMGYSVRARVHLGPGNDHFHDCGELGGVGSHAEAVARWGTITWKPEGLYVGTGRPDDYFLPRGQFEAHR